MKELSQKMRSAFLCLLAFLITLFGGFCLGKASYMRESSPIQETIETDSKADLRLPGETETRTITTREVKTKLLKIGELATYAAEYTVSESEEEARNILDNIKIPGTGNALYITCTGIVKVGYSINELSPTVDNDSHKIYIAIPSAQLLDNHVYWDSIECTEKNSILNPITFSQYQELIEVVQQKGLEDAESKGIYKAAEENLKNIVVNFLSCFDGYEVVFI